MGTLFTTELIQGVNVVGHFVFTKELLPLLLRTAKSSDQNSTRVIWTASRGHYEAPKNIINFEDVNLPHSSSPVRYGQSKAVYRAMIFTNGSRGIYY
jgi:NAD(P)-dependent dehydrogenase (short-subunit alcohol dehydrogenase family)